jgi:hypothetical protein
VRRIYVDVETLPEVAVPPPSFADADAALKYAEEWRGTALDPGRGRLLAIGVAIDRGSVSVRCDNDELVLLNWLRDLLSDCGITDRKDGCWIAWNAPFDISFLRTRSAVWHLDLPSIIPWRRWDQRILDLREVWLCGRRDSGRYATAMRSGLADAAQALGLGGKAEGLTGATVLDAYLAGRHADIAAYCARDVELLRMIDRRLLP